MSELISVVHFTFHEGKLEEFKRLSAECLEIVRTKDPGTLQYDTFLSDDESQAVVIERFRDVQSLIEHSANIGDEMMAKIVATGEVHGELLGDPGPEVRANIGEGGPVRLFSPYQALNP